MANISCTVVYPGEVICNGTKYAISEGKLVSGSSEFWMYLLIYIFLMLFAGLMSGLTLGLLGLDYTQLEILTTAGKEKEKKYAARIWPLVKKHHLLLVTLLLANAGAVEAMPIFMDKITSPLVAIVVSVSAVLIFGEIIPQSLCSRYGLAIGYYLAPLVYVLMGLFFIVAWPIAKFLDCLLGKSQASFFRRSELKALVDVHKRLEAENEEPLSLDEALIIQGALDLKSKVAADALIALEFVFMLESTARLDAKMMDRIIETGHSRIPVYEGTRENIIGILLVKTAIKLDPDDAECVQSHVRRSDLMTFMEDEPLYNILNSFQSGKSHICIVKKLINGNEDQIVTCGILTLEDVIEEILQVEIIDETDEYEDISKRIKVARLRRRISKSIASGSRFTSAVNSALATPAVSSSSRLKEERAPLLQVTNQLV